MTLKFGSHKKQSNQTMRQRLTIMSNMISELKGTDQELTTEQHIQDMIPPILNAWEHLKIILTHYDNIKTFDDVARHVELEKDRFLADKTSGQAYMTESKKFETFGTKWKN